MNTTRVLYHIFRADFLERIRRPRFLVLLVLTLYLTYLFVPPAESDYLTIALDSSRGAYNSPWIGTMFGIAISVIVSLFAFYLVKNAVDRDRKTGVGQVLAATPLRKFQYTLAKWLSNLVLLTVLVTIVMVMALAMQLLRGESHEIDLWALVAPIWLMGLPVMGIVAGIAVLFETIPFLSRGFGNVVYFFLWTFFLIFSLTNSFSEGTTIVNARNDLFGLTRPVADMQVQYASIDPDYSGDFSIGRSGFDAPVSFFEWDGVSWGPAVILERLLWLALGVLFALLAALPFDRFDPARSLRGDQAKPGRMTRLGGWLSERAGSLVAIAGKGLDVPLRLVTRIVRSSPFGVTFLAELKMALRGQPGWWYALVVLFFLLGLFSPLGSSLRNILPFAWLTPVLVWSGLGVREERYATQGLVFSAPYLLRRQLPATWLAGTGVAVVTASGFGLRILFAGEWAHLLAFLVAVGFIPALALALGIWSGTNRAFEIVYLLWWYLIVNGLWQIDFMGTTGQALEGGRPLIFLLGSLLLLLLAGFGRYRQTNR